MHSNRLYAPWNKWKKLNDIFREISKKSKFILSVGWGGEVTCPATHKLWLEEFIFSDTDLISNYIESDWGLIGNKFLFNDYCQVNIKTDSHYIAPFGLELDM